VPGRACHPRQVEHRASFIRLHRIQSSGRSVTSGVRVFQVSKCTSTPNKAKFQSGLKYEFNW
jgi:hypothetical protein